MRCIHCSEKAVFETPPLCKSHFSEYFERTVLRTINDFKLIRKGENLAVASSGGKDSNVLLFVLKKLGFKVTALAINEGIGGYRSLLLDSLRKFCLQQEIPLKIYDFREEYGFGTDDIAGHGGVCRRCGTLRRRLINIKAASFDVIATGHNLDDELQSLMMNIVKNNHEVAARIGPSSGVFNSQEAARYGFTRRVKPLFFLSEKEVVIYALLNRIPMINASCPYSSSSMRRHLKIPISRMEDESPGIKRRIIRGFMKISGPLKKSYGSSRPNRCVICGQPSKSRICSACRIASEIEEKLANSH